MKVCPSCARENPDDARFCSYCATALTETPAPREERKFVTVLFCDLVGSTAQAERLDPEDVRALLSRYHERVRAELERFGGTVEKFIGDAVMALFGAPVAHEDDPERAVRAALAIREWADEEGELHVRIGITTGEALVTLGARPEAGEGMAAGDVVNTAARLQAAAPVDGILVDEATYRATHSVVTYRDSDAVQAKGKARPVRAWEPVEARSRLGVDVVQESRAPLVGRDRELALLSDALTRAVAERSPQLVTLVGVPGIGKSRLVYELMQIARRDDDGVIWRQGRCLPYGEGITFWALGEIVKSHAGIFETDTADQAAAKLERSVADVVSDDDDRSRVGRHLEALIGIGDGGDVFSDREAEAFAAWRHFFEGLGDIAPAVLVVEDLHWADDKLLDFLDQVAETVRDTRLLLLCTARPELLDRRPGWGGGKANALTLSLSPLRDEDTARLLAALLERRVLPAEVQQAVLERAGGNPLFAEQYSRLVAEGTDVDGSRIPDSVQALIAARLDALSPVEKRVLHDASVHGKVFWLGAVAALGGEERQPVEAALAGLERKEFVRRQRRSSVAGETEYAFRHFLVRDVAYGQIPRADRADKHRRAAEWIEALAEDRDDHVELLAEHYVRTRELLHALGRDLHEVDTRARVALADAGRRAMRLNAFAAAARFYAQALDLWPRAERGRAEVLLAYGRALRWAEDGGDDALVEARDALLAQGDREGAAEADLALGELAFRRDGDRKRALEHVERATELVADAPPSLAKAAVLEMRARMHLVGSDYDRAIAAGREALAAAEEFGNAEIRANALNTIGTARTNTGDCGGVADVERSLELAREANSGSALLRAYNNLAVALDNLGEWKRSTEALEAGLREAERLGQPGLARWVRGNLAGNYYLAGEWDKALLTTTEFIAEAETAPTAQEHNCRAVRSAILFLRGDESAALDDARRAVELARAAGDLSHLAADLANLAWILFESGRRDEVEPVLDELVETQRAVPRVAMWPDIVAIFRAFGREDDVREIADNAAPSLLSEPLRLAARGRYDLAAEEFARQGVPAGEAHLRIVAAREGGPHAREHAARALEFFRSVGATRYVTELEAMLAAAA